MVVTGRGKLHFSFYVIAGVLGMCTSVYALRPSLEQYHAKTGKEGGVEGRRPGN
jgi:hypothetical protein